ncbi:hypothetical protein GP486_001249 [Trichoglossum hirsutum]|uniref:Uncharacterized protein n=1 Tax=Trichoglossum hirsutum TaxID=265104 RepID=A0A9P8RSV9_9PEZI|nr:hypothetical protein GP486_001249 [Trichoglossum hirsutum]
MLRRARDSDIRELGSQEDSRSVFDLQHASRYRIVLLRSLESSPYVRTEALVTLSKLITQWREEYAISKQEWEESRAAVVAFARPKYNRTDSFQMGFEEVFDTEHDERSLPSIAEGTSRLSSRLPSPRTEDWLRTGEKRSTYPSAPLAIHDASSTAKDDKNHSKKEPGLYFRVHFGRELEDLLKEGGIRIRSKWRDRGFIPDNSKDEIISDADVQEHLRRFYLGLIRYNGDCPYKDIRTGCKTLLKKLEALGAEIPQLRFRGIHSPSFFINFKDTIGIDDGLKSRGNGFDSVDRPTSPPPKPSLASQAWSEDGDGSIPEAVVKGIRIPGASSFNRDGSRLGRMSKQSTTSSSSSLKSTRGGIAVHGYSGSMPRHLAHPLPMPHSPQLGQGAPFLRSRGRLRSLLKSTARIPSKTVQDLHLTHFRHYGRVTNFYKILSVSPQFAIAHMDITNEILFYNLPFIIPLDQRVYLGIMAAAEMKCQYFMTLVSEQFLQTPARGHRIWLQGLDSVPPKLRGLAKYNTLLAHEPWRITKHHIRELTELKWQLHDILQATLVLSFYHSMSAFALACGIIPEADLPGGTAKSSEIGTSTMRLPGTPSIPKRPSTATHGTSTGANEKHGIVSPPEASSLSRKRQTDRYSEEHQSDPDKWPKKPHGLLPKPPTRENPVVGSAASGKAPAATALTGHGFKRDGTSRDREVKGRRKSFDDCATNDDGLHEGDLACSPSAAMPFPPGSLSGSAPTARGREYLYSPCSSTSSFMNESADHVMMQLWAKNVVIEGHEKFLHPDSVQAKAAEFDVHSSSYSFLDETDFSFRDSTNSVLGLISSHFDGLDKSLDKYFKAAEHADLENCQSFKALSQKMSPRLGFSRSSSVANLTNLPVSAADDPSIPSDLNRIDFLASRLGKSTFDLGDPDGDFNFEFGSDGIHTPQAGEGASPGSPVGHRHSRQSSINSTQDWGYPVKEAVWAYALRMLGYQKQSYPYRDIKILVAKSTRRFIKRLCIAPHLITLADWTGVAGETEKDEEGICMTKMSSDEKVLIAIYASQARWQGQILQALNAANDFWGTS